MRRKWSIIYLFSDDFGLRKPRHSEMIYAKKRYTSILARVLYGTDAQFSFFWGSSLLNAFATGKPFLGTNYLK